MGERCLISAFSSLVQAVDLSPLLSIVKVLNFIFHELCVVKLIKRVNSIGYCGARGADGTVKLIHGARDELGAGQDVVLKEAHLLREGFVIGEFPFKLVRLKL